MEEYEALRSVWKHLKQPNLRDDLGQYLADKSDTEIPADFEPAFFRRLPWFPYFGLTSPDEPDLLARRQLFFGSFYTALTSTNAYKVGGAQSVAPILQNNPSKELIAYALRWERGETPEETGFEVFGSGLDDRRDRSRYTAVVELFGFLNLHQQPFYNSAAAEAYIGAKAGDQSPLEAVREIGEQTRGFLAGDPKLVATLSVLFREMVAAVEPEWRLVMEGLRGRAAKLHPGEAEKLIDRRLGEEIAEAAVAKANEMADEDAAATLFHIMLDATTYAARPNGDGGRSGGGTSKTPPVQKKETVPGGSPESKISVGEIELPLSLAPMADNALAYLRSGYHVLLAGAPGTGKTTLAQLVGHAWNKHLEKIPRKIPIAEAPLTTVANSAWAPFHTIGGILPDKNGLFVVQQGIFIDPTEGPAAEWRLRPECVVLDEMNRADLDRCVGELYPLLTHSVPTVVPAGIPGVTQISDHPKFRLIATVNDATIDDIVFPISEGLARRFVRLELRGATEDEVKRYLQLRAGDENQDRYETAAELVGEFFSLCGTAGRIQQSESGDHLFFGVGYFSLLGSWVGGQLQMSKEFSERELREQAFEVLGTSLRSATRDRGYEPVFKDLRPGQA